MEQVELEPCPFCGGEAQWDCMTSNEQYECTEWSPECPKCGATVILDRTCGKHEAAAAWNTRTNDQAKNEEIARLREALELAANRMQRLSLELPFSTAERYEAEEWAQEARHELKDKPRG